MDKALNDGFAEVAQVKTEVPDSGAEKPEAHAEQQKNSFGNEEKESTKASETEGSGHASSGLETSEQAIEPIGADNIVNNKEKTGCEAGAYPENKGIFRKSASHSVYEDMWEEDFSASRSVVSPPHNGQLSASDTISGASMYETLLSSGTDLSPDDDKAETTRNNPQSGPNAVNNETDQTGGGR